MGVRGFILQPSYRIQAGKPVIHLFGRLETGETFLIRDDRTTPHFYIEKKDLKWAQELGAENIQASDRRTMDGKPVLRVNVRVPPDTPALRDRLRQNGIPCYEADVRFAIRFLIARDIRGALQIDGPWTEGRGIDRVYDNPELQPADWTPELKVLSFDIETDPRAQKLLAVALYGHDVAEVLIRSAEDEEVPPNAVGFDDERELLRAFCARVREIDPDVLTGWNVVDFDLRVLERMAKNCGLPLDLARGPGNVRLRPSRAPWSTHEAIIPGRVVLDGMHLLRGSFIKMDEYSLDAVAQEILGEGKTLHGRDRVWEIMRLYREDRPAFVDYNLTDARLVVDILDKLKLIQLSVERSKLTGMPIDRVAGSIASFDFLYMAELYKRGIVAPSVGSRADAGGADSGGADFGGYVLEPVTGLHENVLVFDFKSLYPSVIRTFQIDPLGYLPHGAQENDAIVAPNGAAFRRAPGILTRLLNQLFPRRELAKASGDAVTSHAIKILMNSFYGVLGTPACRFYRPQIASAITSFGQKILLFTKARFEDRGYAVLYGDTDSLFVLSGEEDPHRARDLGERLVRELNRDVARWIEDQWQVKSRLELEFERLYHKLVLPEMRHGRGGARKRYVGLVGEGDDAEVKFVGMEVVRRDWTELAKRVQRELYQRLFLGGRVEEYLATVVEDLRGGELDELLVYRKGLRKSLDEYTATTPPHVAAARKLSKKPGRVIKYVITQNGPEPAAERRSAVDHEHYVQKQIRPVAEPVLALLALDFDKVIGDDAQMELF